MYTHEELKELCCKLCTNEIDMKTVDLSNCGICGQTAEMVAAVIAVNTTLTEVNLANNNIGDNGARQIAAALLNNTTLTSLNLNSNEITDVGTRALSDVLG